MTFRVFGLLGASAVAVLSVGCGGRQSHMVVDTIIGRGVSDGDVEIGKPMPPAEERLVKLLDRGADANETTSIRGGTALNLAIMKGSLPMVRALLQHGADPERPEQSSSRTPLSYAAEGGDAEIVRALIAAGADPAKVDASGDYPIAYSADAKVAALLLTPKVDLARLSGSGRTVVTLAATNKRYDVVEFLLKSGADQALKHPGSEIATPDMKMLDLLIRYGGDVNEEFVEFKGEDAQRPILYAAARSNTDQLAALVERKAKVDVADSKGWTALHLAARNGDAAAVKLLLDAGARIDARDKLGRTPLHFAAIGTTWKNPYRDQPVREPHGSLPTVRELLAHHAPVDAEDDNGWTPLFRAATNNNLGAMKLLLVGGADGKHRDKEGKTPLDAIKDLDRQDAKKLLGGAR